MKYSIFILLVVIIVLPSCKKAKQEEHQIVSYPYDQHYSINYYHTKDSMELLAQFRNQYSTAPNYEPDLDLLSNESITMNDAAPAVGVISPHTYSWNMSGLHDVKFNLYTKNKTLENTGKASVMNYYDFVDLPDTIHMSQDLVVKWSGPHRAQYEYFSVSCKFNDTKVAEGGEADAIADSMHMFGAVYLITKPVGKTRISLFWHKNDYNLNARDGDMKGLIEYSSYTQKDVWLVP
jgi:hypothetical protein